MRKPFLWCCAVGLLLMMCAPFALRGSNEAWDAGLKRYRLQLSRDMAFLEKNGGSFDIYCDRLLSRFEATQGKVEVLCFMMLQRNRYDAFAVALYSDRIAALVNECRLDLADFQAMRRRLTEIQQVYDAMSQGLTGFSLEKLTANQQQLLQEDIEANRQFDIRFREFEANANKVAERLTASLAAMTTIADLSTERQNEVIRTIFFDNETNFIKTIPQGAAVIGYWLSDCFDTLKVQFEGVNSNLWSLFIYALGFAAALTGIGYLVYVKLLRELLERKMPELFARRFQFRRNFFLLIGGFSIYWGEWMTTELDMQAFRQFAIGLIMLACLRLALTLRLDREQQKIALPIYYPAIVTYFLSMLLSVGMISYSPLIILSTLLGFLATLWTLAGVRHFKRFETMERIFGICTAVNYALAAALGFLGFAYMSLTMMLGWFVIVALFQAIVALGTFVRQYVAADTRHPVFNQILSHFFLPAAWLWLLIYLFGWVVKTYYIEARIYALLDMNLIEQATIAQFNTREVFLVIFVGLGLYFVIGVVKLVTKGILGDTAEFGLIPSFIILSNYVLWALYVIFVLVVFKVQYSSILVVVGGMSMGLGFGLKEIVENFIAGLILLIGQQVRPGDIVEVKSDGTIGKVLQVSVRATVVETYDGAIITYPNAQVLTKEFQNWTSNNMMRRHSLSIGVAYGADLAVVTRLILEAAQQVQGVAKRPAPEVLCSDFGASSVDFSLRYWANVSSYNAIGSNLRREIYRSFAEHGISIPFPQLDVHIQPSDEGAVS